MAKKKKKRTIKIKKVPIILLIILIIIIGLFMHYNSKKYLYTKAFNKSINMKLESYNEMKSKYSPYVDDNHCIETDTIFDYNENKNKVDGKICIEESNNYIDLNVKQNDTENKVSIINKDSKAYYKIKDDYYYMPYTNNYDVTLKEITDIVSKYFRKYIRNGTLSKKKETIKYDKSYKTNKLILKLSNKDYYNFLLDVLKDKKIKDLYDDNDFIEKIEEKKKSEKTINDYFEYSLYTYKGTPILEEFVIKENNLKISAFNNNDYKHIKIMKDKSKKESYIIIKDNKIDLFIDEYLYGKGTITDNSINIKFTDLNKEEIGSLSYKIENNDKIYNATFKMNTNLESLKLNIDINNKIDTSKSIPSIDLKGAKKITDLKEEDLDILRGLLTN